VHVDEKILERDLPIPGAVPELHDIRSSDAILFKDGIHFVTQPIFGPIFSTTTVCLASAGRLRR
jgi:hypothetical protein